MSARAAKPVGNLAALELTLRALNPNDEAAAVVEAARSLASAVDADKSNDALWREYRFALVALREACSNGDEDKLESVLDAVRSAVRNH